MPVYRLYNHLTKEFIGPAETKLEVIKRLSRMTSRRRDTLTNWVRLTHSPVEVEGAHPCKLTKTAALESREYRRYLYSLEKIADAESEIP